MVDIVVDTISPVHNQSGKREDRRGSDGSKKRRRRERRLNQSDRRRGVREGVVVTLSTRSDRLKSSDRRKGNSSSYPPGWGKTM